MQNETLPESHHYGARAGVLAYGSRPLVSIRYVTLRYVNITAYGVILRLERTITRAGYS